jgi:hypothetical protein
LLFLKQIFLCEGNRYLFWSSSIHHRHHHHQIFLSPFSYLDTTSFFFSFFLTTS